MSPHTRRQFLGGLMTAAALAPVRALASAVKPVTIQDVEIFPIDEGGDEYRVESNFVLYELARQATGDLRLWTGRTTHRLRRVEGQLRIAAKRVDLVNASGPIPNLTFLI